MYSGLPLKGIAFVYRNNFTGKGGSVLLDVYKNLVQMEPLR